MAISWENITHIQFVCEQWASYGNCRQFIQAKLLNIFYEKLTMCLLRKVYTAEWVKKKKKKMTKDKEAKVKKQVFIECVYRRFC